MSEGYIKYFEEQLKKESIVIDENKLQQLKGKPYFGDRMWKIGDKVLFAALQEEYQPEVLQNINLKMVSLSDKHLKELEASFDYVTTVGIVPQFKRK